ncbi:MAG: hypothetical protein IPO22_13015 [Anaerolineales bacterium]|nr:hypothetical protein [Anaerolineales bacterium]
MKLNRSTFILVSLLILLFAGLTLVIMKLVPAGLGIDWRLTYRPAAVALMQGKNPYDVEVSPEAPFFAAPWGLLPFLPLALFPVEVGRAMVMLIGIIVFAFTAYRLGATPFTMALFLLSPPVVHTILNANIEWLPILGFALPPPIGLFFITIKPQTGFAVGIFWLFDSWQKGGIRLVIRNFAPVTIAYLISFAFFGLWPLGMFGVIKYGQGFNSSLWPVSIPVGLVLLVTAIQKRDAKYAMSASPCLSPYVLFHAWSSAFIALINSPLQMATAVIGLWIVVVIRFFS